jgi:hypothetical protein
MVPDCHRIQFGLNRCPSPPSFSPQTGSYKSRSWSLTLPSFFLSLFWVSTAVVQSCDLETGRDCRALRQPICQTRRATTFLSNPSASSLHHIKQIHELSTRCFVRAVVETVRGQPSQRKSMTPLSATLSRVNQRHYEAPLGAARAIGTCSDRDVAFREV